MEALIMAIVCIMLGFCFITLIGLFIEYITWCEKEEAFRKEYFVDDE